MPPRKPAWEPTEEDLARAGAWPVQCDTEYGEPVIICSGQVMYRSDKILKSFPEGIPQQCCGSISGGTPDEIRIAMARHLHFTEHLPLPGVN